MIGKLKGIHSKTESRVRLSKIGQNPRKFVTIIIISFLSKSPFGFYFCFLHGGGTVKGFIALFSVENSISSVSEVGE
jgi:hypothetical protein